MTVALVDPDRRAALFDEADVDVEWFSGTGAGGQHRNKCQNSARCRHRPTGLVRAAQTRSRANSLAVAMTALKAAVEAQADAGAAAQANGGRRAQIGSGERSDKRRTWRFQDDAVVDHVTGRRARLADVMRGGHAALWR